MGSRIFQSWPAFSIVQLLIIFTTLFILFRSPSFSPLKEAYFSFSNLMFYSIQFYELNGQRHIFFSYYYRE